MSETYSIGVDLGGTNLRIASYVDGIEFLDIIRIPTRLAEGRDQVARNMCEAINALTAREYGRRLAGIGTPGPLELPKGVLFAPTIFQDLRDRSYVYRLTRPDVIEPTRFEPQKTYILSAQLGTSAGLPGECLLAVQKKSAHRVGKDDLVHQ